MTHFFFKGGEILHYESSSDIVECWLWCTSTAECNWFSYEKTGIQACALFDTCPEIEENQSQYISGHKDCQYTYCMLSRYF